MSELEELSIDISSQNIDEGDAQSLIRELKSGTVDSTNNISGELSITEAEINADEEAMLDKLTPWAEVASLTVELGIEMSQEIPTAVVATYICEKLSSHDISKIEINGEVVPVSSDEVREYIQSERA